MLIIPSRRVCFLVVSISAFLTRAKAQDLGLDTLIISDPCDPRHSVLDALTHRFRSDCNARQWCKPTATLDHDPLLGLPTLALPAPVQVKRQEATGPTTAATAMEILPHSMPLFKPGSPLKTEMSAAVPTHTTAVGDNGVCVDKRCRRDEFPFGYKGVAFDQLPRQCNEDQYCPDDESQCQPLIELGKQCQLNRDDSCQQPHNQRPIRTLCLQGLCRLADSGESEVCLLDSTAYLGYNESGQGVIATVTRDNCQDGLYCEESTSQCKRERGTGSACEENRECIEFNCSNESKTCQHAPQSIHQLPPWSWALIALSILASLAALAFALYRIHLRHRSKRSEEIDQFFSEQWTYRHSILSMHAAAALASTRPSDGGEDGKEKDQAWSSSLCIGASPTSSSPSLLSPRLSRRPNDSPERRKY